MKKTYIRPLAKEYQIACMKMLCGSGETVTSVTKGDINDSGKPETTLWGEHNGIFGE